MQKLVIQSIPGSVAPRYNPGETKELKLDKAVITERGMESGKPLVDLQVTGEDGQRYFIAATGSLIIGLGKAVQGVNLRNHGNPDP